MGVSRRWLYLFLMVQFVLSPVISDLKGAVITSLQAMDLLPLLGVIIED